MGVGWKQWMGKIALVWFNWILADSIGRQCPLFMHACVKARIRLYLPFYYCVVFPLHEKFSKILGQSRWNAPISKGSFLFCCWGYKIWRPPQGLIDGPAVKSNVHDFKHQSHCEKWFSESSCNHTNNYIYWQEWKCWKWNIFHSVLLFNTQNCLSIYHLKKKTLEFCKSPL